MKRYIFLILQGLLISLFGLITGCTPVLVKTKDNVNKDIYTFTSDQLPVEPKKPFPTANVDYDKHNRMVFFNFNTGTMQTINNTVWDIAIAVGDTSDTAPSGSALSAPDKIYTVTNSGDYGEYTRLLPLKTGKKSADYLGQRLDEIKQVSFKYGEQELSPFQTDPDTGKLTANPFYAALTNGKHYLLKIGKSDDTAKVYELWFDKITPAVGSSFTLHVKPAILSETEPKTINGFMPEYILSENISGNYSFNYIKLDTDSAKVLNKSRDGIPEKNEWHLLFMRTNVYSKEMGYDIQFETLFTDDLYLHIGENAIRAADTIRTFLDSHGYEQYFSAPTNQIFIVLENTRYAELSKKITFGFWEKKDDSHTVVRIATDWATTPENVEKLLQALA